MPTLDIPERAAFWLAFDENYKRFHPDLLPMRHIRWELPHWMTWLGGCLRANGFANIDISWWTNDTLLNKEEVICRLQQIAFASDVVLLSPMIPNLHVAIDFIAKLKHYNSALCVLLGGVTAKPLADHLCKCSEADFVVVGRAERTLPLILTKLTQGDTDFSDIPNIHYRTANGEAVETSSSPEWIEPSVIPWPAIDIIPGEYGGDLRYLRVVHGLGCPYTCPFCTIPTIGRKQSFFTVERTLSEIDGYRDRFGGHHYIYFGDETFLLNQRDYQPLLQTLGERGDIGYDCQTRLSCAAQESTVMLMAKSGCRWIEIGLEAASQPALDRFKQRTSLKALREQLETFRSAGIGTCSFMVNGLPEMTCEQMRDSIDVVAELVSEDLLVATYLFGLVPYPGSKFYSNPELYGMTLRHHDYSMYNEESLPVYDTSLAQAEDIYEMFTYGVRTLGRAMGSKCDVPVNGSATQGQAFVGGSHV